ncbi:MAG: type II toxin-antitoxin system HicB family antitoxin [Actinomycetota bacterium]|jgi:antitoxin HicB|nr:type II toxin-antitoxin system HicB family antitoxin [Actinomycetota bacterium]
MTEATEYEIVLIPQPEGGYTVLVPELPGVVTEGDSIEEAVVMAKDAIEGYLEAMHDHGWPIEKVERRRIAVHPA